MTITLVDLLMAEGYRPNDVTKADWAALGRGEVTDEDRISAILASDYDALEE